MAVRRDPLESGKQRIQEGITKLSELTEPLDVYRDCLRSQIEEFDKKRDVCRHRVASSFSRIAKLIGAKEQEMLQLLDDACEEAKNAAGDKLRETESVSEATAEVSAMYCAVDCAARCVSCLHAQLLFCLFSYHECKLAYEWKF